MSMKEEVEEMKKEVENIKKEKIKMKEKEMPIATEVAKLLIRTNKRLFVLFIIITILLIISIIDSFYQRQRIIDILSEYEVVEETVETYEMDTENGNNNYIGGDNNGKVENN